MVLTVIHKNDQFLKLLYLSFGIVSIILSNFLIPIFLFDIGTLHDLG